MKVKTMLTEVLTNLEKEIKANDAKMDPFITEAAKMWAAVEKAQDDVDAAEDAKNAYTADIDAEIISCQSYVDDLTQIQKGPCCTNQFYYRWYSYKSYYSRTIC